MRPDRLKLLLLALLIIVITAVYWRSLGGDFVAWDDTINIVYNSRIQGLDADRITWMFTDTEKALRYKPLSWLAWALVYECFGLNPFGFHFANLLLHYLNTILLFQLLLCLFSNYGDGKLARCKLWICAWAALVWAVHPLRVEPIAWITGLPYSLSLVFLLTSLLLYLQANDGSTTSRRRTIVYSVSVFAFLLSALSYPTGLTFPCVLLVLDIFPLGRWKPGDELTKLRRLCFEKVPFFIIAGLLISLTLYGRVQAGGIWSKPESLGEFGLLSRMMQAFYIWAYYVWKFWIPFNLSPRYVTLISFNPLAWQFILSACLILVLTAWLACKRRQLPLLFATWVSYLVLLIPVLGLTEHPHFPSDRYGFIVGILWSILLAAGMISWIRGTKARPLFVAAGGTAILGTFALMSYQLNEVWQDTTTVYRRIAESEPNNPVLLTHLGSAYRHRQQYFAALDSYLQALRLSPQDISLHHMIATVYFELNRLPEARKYYGTILRADPENGKYHNEFGVVLAAGGDLTNAIVEFGTALRLDPTLSSAQRNLAKAFMQQGRGEEAEPCLDNDSIKSLP